MGHFMIECPAYAKERVTIVKLDILREKVSDAFRLAEECRPGGADLSVVEMHLSSTVGLTTILLGLNPAGELSRLALSDVANGCVVGFPGEADIEFSPARLFARLHIDAGDKAKRDWELETRELIEKEVFGGMPSASPDSLHDVTEWLENQLLTGSPESPSLTQAQEWATGLMDRVVARTTQFLAVAAISRRAHLVDAGCYKS